MTRSRFSGLPISRRRFVQGIAAAGTLTVLPFPLRHAFAASSPSILSGSAFALEIGPVPMNVTGQPRTAIGVNGQVPAPILRWREGDTVTLSVTNRLSEPTSIHWHGIRTPAPMDGVPGLSFAGIAPGETFTYHFPVHQSGTYWYHSHSGFQEQSGLYGPLVIEPRGGYAEAFDRDYVVMLSDWSDESPETIVSNLKMQSDYYNYGQRTAGTFFADVRKKGLGETISDRLEWGKMRMSPTDILDVTGATYTYLVNGQSPAANWTALFRPGERVRLRFINEIVLHLSGNMQRFIWGFDGKKFSEAEPIRLARNERVRFVLINDTMMDHPIHLHGLWSELENGESDYRPYKHTILVKPGERVSYLVTADEPGRWAYHCHLLYHMEMGMFREVRVS